MTTTTKEVAFAAGGVGIGVGVAAVAYGVTSAEGAEGMAIGLIPIIVLYFIRMLTYSLRPRKG
jgi:hypothetical protein